MVVEPNRTLIATNIKIVNKNVYLRFFSPWHEPQHRSIPSVVVIAYTEVKIEPSVAKFQRFSWQ